MIPGIPWIRIGIFAIALIAVVTVIGLAWSHYTGLLEDKVELEKQVTNLRTELVTTQAQRDLAVQNSKSWQEAHERDRLVVEEATRVQQQATQQIRELNNVLSKHDLAVLAARKPGLVESRVNDGTADALRLLNLQSGGSPGGGAPDGAAEAP